MRPAAVRLTGGWGGIHPVGAQVFVVTHTVPDGWPRADAPFTFVTDGIESALAQAAAVAGDQIVAVATPTLTRQLLDLGLLDEISVSVAPVLLGRGTLTRRLPGIVSTDRLINQMVESVEI